MENLKKKKGTVKIVTGFIAVLFIALIIVVCMKKNERVFDLERKSIIEEVQRHSETLDVLENLYEREQTELVMGIEDNQLNIPRGSAEHISEEEKEIITGFCNDLECERIFIEKGEDGIKYLRLVFATRTTRTIDEEYWYFPEIYYCSEQDKYMECYGETMSERYGEEFRKNWYYTICGYT